MKKNATQLPEAFKDKLEAYPLHLNVSALPDRVFFKMTRFLTISVVLLSAILLSSSVFLNYQISHLDISLHNGSYWQFFSIDPLEKKLTAVEPLSISLNPELLAIEEKLSHYILMRNTTVWNQDTMSFNFGNNGLIAKLSSPNVFTAFQTKAQNMINTTRGASLIREAHIFDLKLLNSNLWQAIIETYDLRVTDDLNSVCNCSDNSKKCLDCKKLFAVNRERNKIYIRTSFSRPKSLINPLGISVDSYISTYVPIHDDEPYWNLPPDLRPEI